MPADPPAAADPPAMSWWQRLRWRQTSRAEALAAEARLLALAPPLPGGAPPLRARDVRVGPGPEDFMHTLVGGEANAASPPLVLIPGYGSGSATAWRCLPALAAGWRVFAVDLLGTGLSGRPPFRARTTPAAEAFFVDSLEAWRAAAGVDAPMVLVGHSLGGYLAACYAMAHPGRVAHLVLVCPAGVGRRPDGWAPPFAPPRPWTLRAAALRASLAAWEWGATPGGVVRAAGPWGPRLAQRYARARFQRGHGLSEPEAGALADYFYGVLAARGSGEHALRHLLGPYAWARAPLEARILPGAAAAGGSGAADGAAAAGGAPAASGAASPLAGVRLSFVYGEHDWIPMLDPGSAARVCEGLKRARREAAGADGAAAAAAAACDGADLTIATTKNAGHWPMIDQPRGYAAAVTAAAGELLPPAARAAVDAALAALPFPTDAPTEDSAAELAAELQGAPAAAEARMASEM